MGMVRNPNDQYQLLVALTGFLKVEWVCWMPMIAAIWVCSPGRRRWPGSCDFHGGVAQ